MKWDEVSDKARDVMKSLGNFGPTVNAANREVKGSTYDEDCEDCGGCVKTYYTSADLREIAAACAEVADWLDKRADEAGQP